MSKILVIDGNSLINRAYFAIPALSNKAGVPTNATYGFINMLMKLMEDHKPEYVSVCFDLKGPTFRHEEYSDYKGQRKGMDDELRVQFPVIKSFLNALGINISELQGFEADDLIGTIARVFSEKGDEVTIVTGDKDALQLANDQVSIMLTRKGISVLDVYTPQKVQEEYGLTPSQIPDYKGLSGDASDNIKGLPGVGPKTATKLLHEFSTVENLVENADKISNDRIRNIVLENSQVALLSKRLATIVVDVPVDIDTDDFRVGEQNREELLSLINEYELKTLLKHVSPGNSITQGEGNIQGGIDQNGFKEEEVKRINICHIGLKEEKEQILKELSESDRISVKIIYEKNDLRNDRILGIGCYGGDENYYFEMGEDQGDKGLFELLEDNETTDSYDEGLEFLKSLFSQDKVFVGFDIKADFLALMINGIKIPQRAFDIQIAQYLIDPDRRKYLLEDEAIERAPGIQVMSEEMLLGSGVKKTTFSRCKQEDLIRFACSRSYAGYEIMPGILEELEDNEVHDLFWNVEMPLVEVLASMEYEGFSVDERVLDDLDVEITAELERLTTGIFEYAGEEFNINSPKQLGEILFERLQLPTMKKTKTGYSTNADVLEKLKTAHPIISLIMEYRTYSKLKSTYIDGLRSVINYNTGKIHTSLNQTVAGTGRLSSTEPNLQNIPVRLPLGRKLRKLFVAGQGNTLIDADYSQIELRILAELSDDEIMKDSFTNSKDIHAITASQVFGIPLEDVGDEERGRAKAVNFGIVYGMSDFGLSETLGIPVKTAKNYIEGYFKTYPRIKKFLDSCVVDCRRLGYAKTVLGRRRTVKDIDSKNFNLRSYAERAAMNTPIQGSAADIMKLAMLKTYNELKDRNMESKLILQVHDELIVDGNPQEIQEVKEILKESMEGALKGFAEFQVPLTCSMNTGKSWYDAK